MDSVIATFGRSYSGMRVAPLEVCCVLTTHDRAYDENPARREIPASAQPQSRHLGAAVPRRERTVQRRLRLPLWGVTDYELSFLAWFLGLCGRAKRRARRRVRRPLSGPTGIEKNRVLTP